MRSPSSWPHYSFPGSMYGHNLSPTDTYGGGMMHNNSYNSPNSLQQLNIKPGHGNGGGNELGLPGSYNDPRMFGTGGGNTGPLSHNRNSPTNSTGRSTPPPSLSTPYHTENTINVNSNGLPGSHSYQGSTMHATPNPAHSFLGTNSVTINNNYLMNIPGSGAGLNLPFKSYNGTDTNGINRSAEEDVNNNQLNHYYRQPPTLYEAPGSFGYQNTPLKHGYDTHMNDQNGNVNHHGEELDENSTPKVWRPY